MHENTISDWLGELGLTRLQPQPVHPKKNVETEAAFKRMGVCQSLGGLV